MDPLLQSAFSAVESNTAINANVANRPFEAVYDLNKLKSTLSNAGVDSTSYTYTILDDDGVTPIENIVGNTVVWTLSNAIANVSSSANSVSDQITDQLSNLLPNIQTYGHLNDLRVDLGELNANGTAMVGDDITDYFGSIMLPHMCSKIAQRRIERTDPTQDSEQLEAINLRTVRDEVEQINGYSITMLTQATTEPAALANALARLTNLTQAAVMLEYLNVPSTYPILDIVAGDGLRPVVDAVKYGTATDLGFATPPGIDPANPVYPIDSNGYPADDLYGNAVSAPGELPDPPHEADPIPPI